MGALRNFPLQDLVNKYKPLIAIELGSGYGCGTMELYHYPFNSIFSVEIIKEQADFLSKFFRFDTRIKIFNDTTENFLNNALSQIPINIPILFYNDAHYNGADLQLNDFNFEKDENIRLPLWKELNIIKELRINNGAKSDVIIVDDCSIWDESDRVYDDDHKKKTIWDKLEPRNHRNYLPKFIELFKDTHNSEILTKENGWLIFTPK